MCQAVEIELKKIQQLKWKKFVLTVYEIEKIILTKGESNFYANFYLTEIIIILNSPEKSIMIRGRRKYCEMKGQYLAQTITLYRMEPPQLNSKHECPYSTLKNWRPSKREVQIQAKNQKSECSFISICHQTALELEEMPDIGFPKKESIQKQRETCPNQKFLSFHNVEDHLRFALQNGQCDGFHNY